MVYRVFLSSTSRDLVAQREAVLAALAGLDGFAPIAMENFGARDTDARGIEEQKLREADLLVGMLGHCYGSAPPDDPTSFTEQEYDFAVGRQLPRLMFVAPDDFPVPQHLIEPDEKRARQKAFRSRVMGDRVVASFASPEQLATEVTKALVNWRVGRITAELVAAKEAEEKQKEEAAKYREEAAKYREEAARRAELEQTLAEGQEERKALRAAVQALADKAKAPDAPPAVEQALALLPAGRTAEAKEVFAEIVRRKEAEGARKRAEGAADLREAAAAARHLGALAFLDSTAQAIEAYARATRLDPDDAWSWIFLGRLHRQAGSLSAAEEALRSARAAAERAGIERDVMATDIDLGDLQVAHGELSSASRSYQAGMIIAERLAGRDPANADWQRDLSVSLEKIGDVRVAQGERAGALEAYEQSRAIREKLAARDPENALWQLDLSEIERSFGSVRLAGLT